MRKNLISAILNGDPTAYVNQCADDVMVLHPGSPIVTGREDLFQHVQPNPGVKIKKLVSTPVRIYGSGDLAYEVGTQVLEMEPAREGFGPSRKYIHVYLKTENGWKIVAGMSGDN